MNIDRSHREHLLNAALTAAGRGWHVFPLRPGTKRPALHGAQSCPRTGECAGGHRGWEQRATTDTEKIRRCWSDGALWNIGLATGPSGLLVVDLDTRKSPEDEPPDGWKCGGIVDGHDVFTAVCQQHGQTVPWETYSVSTARAGTHLYFTAPSTVELRNTEGSQRNGLGWKVDTRGHGGYVVAPGSVTPDGEYRVTEDCVPADLPGWLVQALTPKPPTAISAPPLRASERLPAYVAAAVEGECNRVTGAQSGAHNKTLFIASVALGQLVGAHLLPSSTAEDALRTAARHMITDQCDCTERKVTRTITDGLRAGTSRPRVARDHPQSASTGELFTARRAS